ncbi:hypothetical protein GCM10010446_26030 [Streptomyces enissocaesilis]|uniref:Uncharacterized protein n=1 Tax=Streptomyces enissocaesilis TaxID=332589 RepID=A0ABN3X8D2_9ACTN
MSWLAHPDRYRTDKGAAERHGLPGTSDRRCEELMARVVLLTGSLAELDTCHALCANALAAGGHEVWVGSVNRVSAHDADVCTIVGGRPPQTEPGPGPCPGHGRAQSGPAGPAGSYCAGAVPETATPA